MDWMADCSIICKRFNCEARCCCALVFVGPSGWLEMTAHCRCSAAILPRID